MKYSMVFAAAAATTAQAACNNEGGNFFCAAVKALKYDGLDVAGKYKAVTGMPSNGACEFKDVPFSGAIAPFDEDLSIHFRGPATIDNIAVYIPKTASKRDEVPAAHSKRHGHQHLHKRVHEHKQEERGVGDTVHAIINGQEVSWQNTWDGKGETPSKAAAPASAPAEKKPGVASNFVKSEKADSSPKSSPKKADTSNVSVGDFARVGYYDAKSGEATGLTFTGNYGGQGSGTFDNTYGSSLAYLNEQGNGGSASPTVLKDGKVPDGKEIAIFSDKACTDSDASCGFYRPKSVAYEGFKGADKVFTFRMTMPMTGSKGWNEDMPALWLLNGKIPRTGQYSDCSCWKSGCGEFDVMEVLASGDTKCKSTFHYTNSIGNSDYIQRPTQGYVNVAVIFSSASASASVKILDDDFKFGTSLTADEVDAMHDDSKSPGTFSKMAIPV